MKLKLAKIPSKTVLKDGLGGPKAGKTMRISRPIQPVEARIKGKKVKLPKEDMSPMKKKLKMKKGY